MSRLRQELSEENQRKIKYNKKNYSIKEFESLVEGKFNQRQQEKVLESAKELYDANKADLLQAEINRYPNTSPVLINIIESKPDKKVNEILYIRANWPQDFTAYFNSELCIEADRLKTREYYAELERDSEARLEALRNGAWQGYLNTFIRNTLNPFLCNTIQTQIKSLQDLFQVVCHKCGNLISFKLTPDNLSNLIMRRPVRVVCPYCKGFWGPTSFDINLGDVIWLLTEGYQSAFWEPRMFDAIIKYKVKEPINYSRK